MFVSTLGLGLGFNVGEAVVRALGELLGDLDATSTVGLGLGIDVGESVVVDVGELLGDVVGDVVGDDVGELLGDVDGESVTASSSDKRIKERVTTYSADDVSGIRSLHSLKAIH